MSLAGGGSVAGVAAGRVGRPGSALAVSGRGPSGIGAEIGVDHLAVCAVDLRGQVRARAVRRGANRGRAPGPVVAELTELVDRVVAEAEGEGLWPAGLAVAVPGLVARDARTVVEESTAPDDREVAPL